MTDWTTFPAWSKFLRGEEGLGNPFHKEPITKKSVFLYSEMAAPLPSGATAGMWFAYPGAREMALHLQFVVLPELFGVWLCRDEWVKDGSRVDLEALFDEARVQESRYIADLPVMQRVTDLIQQAASAKSTKASIEHLQKALRVFNRRWRHTPTWGFHLKPFLTPETVAKDIARRNRCSDLNKKEFLELTGRIFKDPKAEKAFRFALSQAGVI